MKTVSYLAAFLAGFILALLGAVLLKPARAESMSVSMVSISPSPMPSATAFPTHTPTQVPSSTPTSTPQPLTAAGGSVFGWAGEVQCHNCSPFTAKVRVTHYNPTKGKINCWKWSKEFEYCMSNTFSGIPWESTWGFGAACPFEWPIGTWLDIPGVGSYICFDRGDMVTCDQQTGICAVDLLGPGGAAWDGKQFDVTLWVPLKPRKP